MRRKRIARLKRAIRHMSPRHIIKSRLTKGVVQRFADKAGLVYFGHVDQRDDDHRLVRGHTVSASHVDTNYCVGSLRGYDVTLVSRNDVVLGKNLKTEQRCHWLIMTADLKTSKDVPHFYIGHVSRRAAYASSYEQLVPLLLRTALSYPKQFLDTYAVYGRPTHALEIERLIPPEIASVIVSHFKDTSIEIEDNSVYLYIESQHPTTAQLEKIVANGLWLAKSIDELLRNGESR